MSTISELVKRDFNQLSPQSLEQFRRLWSRQLGTTPKNSHILAAYIAASEAEKAVPQVEIAQKLQTRRVRSLSGVVPFAVMTKPFHCPGECTYCPLEPGMPKSYLSDEPAAQRAKRVEFDPAKQMKMRFDQLERTGHVRDKIEIIVIGGTWSAYPLEYRESFIKSIFDSANGKVSSTLEGAQKVNETAARRIVGLSVETRPDWITEDEVKRFRRWGVTKVQVGVQAFDGRILARIRRGHNLKPVAAATQMLRDAGFKICYHFMPNLPGSSPAKDISMARAMYADPRFRPDFVKIYPCMVIPGTALQKEWERGEYQPYSDEELKSVLKEVAALTPRWVRIDRLVRDISKQWVSAGTLKTNMRQDVEAELASEGRPCRCVRCREIKASPHGRPRLHRRSYKTLGGREVFLSFETGGQLYSLLRLRLPEEDSRLFSELKGAAIIREIHTFGTTLALTQRDMRLSQHRGLGKKLVAQAEKEARVSGYSKLAVIASVGTREYYRRLGFVSDGDYMTKAISAGYS